MTSAPARGPSRKAATWIVIAALLVVISGAGLSVFWLTDVLDDDSPEGQYGLRVNDATLELARATAPVPTFWFGRTTIGGDRLDRVDPTVEPDGTVEFSYGVQCRTGGAGCTREGSVRTTGNRRLDRLERGEACWHRSGPAMVHWCARARNGRPSRVTRVFTADRLVELQVGRSTADAALSTPPATGWERLIGDLERFDPDAPRLFSAADPLSCSEYYSASTAVRRDLPPVLRPTGDC